MIFLFNTNIVPNEAIVRVSKISAEKAKSILSGQEFTSAIGHEATAGAMSAILGVEVPVNRINAQPLAFDKAISLKLNGRLQEGVILDSAAMEQMGYTLYLIEFYSTELVIVPSYCADSQLVY